MGQSTPYRGEAIPLLRDGHILTEREIAHCQRIVTEANNPTRVKHVPSHMLRYAQLLLAEAEHRYYQELLKKYPEKDREELMKEAILHHNGQYEREPEPLIGKAIDMPEHKNSSLQS